MSTTKNYAFKTMTFYTQLFCFFLFVNASHENAEKKPDVFANKVNLSDNYIVEWTVNETSIEFKVNVAVDEKGWIFLGFMPKPKNSSVNPERPKLLHDSRGDFVVTWPSSASERTTMDLNTIKNPGVLQKDENSTHMDYHVNVQQLATNTSSRSVLLIHRKLDTGDSQDVIITDQPMWMFAAYGNSEVYLKDLSDITTGNIEDTLMVKDVILVKSNGKDDNKTPWHKVLREQMEKHWITVVLAVSGVLTLVIIGTVYCCFRKRSEFKNKKVKMTFYKEDEDDEARVAFLHSRT
ncbi:hypothetical protein OS493_023794 [Desmophyllum pertusum]|uniref:DOMON domain-containing protein n=1 Tax=Desmophyllum pertusum TaxID=174260 RepID=A0A9X0CLK9_9CNID|nr:hypothetical protein OS493_023794 [Desmophyllum pertusum]